METRRVHRKLRLESLESRNMLATMQPLGDLPGSSFDSKATGISADASTIVGVSETAYGAVSGPMAFRWTASLGIEGLGELSGGFFGSAATAVSADGSVIVGWSYSARSGDGEEAFRWTASEGMKPLGDLPGGWFNSRALGISADGSTVVGRGRTAGGWEAFIWTATDGMRAFLPPINGESEATGISADGSTIIGQTSSGAFRWSASTGLEPLGFWGATAISADGSTIVGNSFETGAAVRWRASTGLEMLEGTSSGFTPNGVSADGSTIVGSGSSEAARWTASSGMESLGFLPGGAWVSSANGVSADGSTIVGESVGVSSGEPNIEAFLLFKPAAAIVLDASTVKLRYEIPTTTFTAPPKFSVYRAAHPSDALISWTAIATDLAIPAKDSTGQSSFAIGTHKVILSLPSAISPTRDKPYLIVVSQDLGFQVTMGNVTNQQIKNIAGRELPVNQLDALNAAMREFGIFTVEQQASFFSQLRSEGLFDVDWQENYTFRENFRLPGATRKPAHTAQGATDQAKLEDYFNYWYGNVLGNGDYASGDGYRFRGRGPIQLTGRANYEAASLALGVDLIATPDLLHDKNNPVAYRAAAWFWSDLKNLNPVASGLIVDFQNLNDVSSQASIRDVNNLLTRRVNGGLNHVVERQADLVKGLREFSSPLTQTSSPPALPSIAMSTGEGRLAGDDSAAITAGISEALYAPVEQAFDAAIVELYEDRSELQEARHLLGYLAHVNNPDLPPQRLGALLVRNPLMSSTVRRNWEQPHPLASHPNDEMATPSDLLPGERREPLLAANSLRGFDDRCEGLRQVATQLKIVISHGLWQ